MKGRQSFLDPFLLCITMFIILSGCDCWGKSSRVTISITDCPANQITITPANYQTTDVGSGTYVLDADILVKCNGNPINNAEIIVSVEGFAGASRTVRTDSTGNYHLQQRTQNAPAKGHELKVTINGSSGAKEQTFIIP